MSEDLGPLSLSGTLDSFYLGSCKACVVLFLVLNLVSFRGS